MVVGIDKLYERDVLAVSARERAADTPRDIVEGHLNARRMQRRLLSVVGIVVAVGLLAAFSIALSDGPLQPPGDTGRLLR